jgi:hypothetical protein
LKRHEGSALPGSRLRSRIVCAPGSALRDGNRAPGSSALQDRLRSRVSALPSALQDASALQDRLRFRISRSRIVCALGSSPLQDRLSAPGDRLPTRIVCAPGSSRSRIVSAPSSAQDRFQVVCAQDRRFPGSSLPLSGSSPSRFQAFAGLTWQARIDKHLIYN